MPPSWREPCLIGPPMGVAFGQHWLILSTGSRIDSGPFDPEGVQARLARALEEARGVFPEERIFAVVLESESPWWGPVLASLPHDNVLEQPIDRGSAIGVLFAFLRIFRSDPAAEVSIVSIEARPGAIRSAVEMKAISSQHDRVLVRLGASGSIAICRGSSAALLRIFQQAQPEVFHQLIEHISARATPDDAYPFLPAIDLFRDVLFRVPDAVRSIGPFEPAGRHPPASCGLSA